MPEKVTFNGGSKLIIVENGITSLTFGPDVYSAWKRWSILSTNLKYSQALRYVGGDPTVGGAFLGSTYFLMNGWKIRPYEGNHELVITGNFFTEDESNPIVPTLGNFIVLTTRATSNLVDTINSGSGLDANQATQLEKTYKNVQLQTALLLS